MRYLLSIFIWVSACGISTNLSATVIPRSPATDVAAILLDVDCQKMTIPDLVSNYEKHPVENYQIKEVEYTACDGKKIQAYVVRPLTTSDNSSSLAAILYVHWLEPHAQDSNRSEFLEEAKIMASKGVASMLISTFWSIPGGYYMERRWQDDYQNTLHQLKDLQHATEILKSIPNVNPHSLHYVGHDYGATFGAMFLAVDRSFSSAVLMAAVADIRDWYLYGSGTGIPQGEELKAFKQQFELLNPYRLIPYSKTKLLFQYAKKDAFISTKQAENLYQQAPQGSEVKFYDTDHSLKLDFVKTDRIQWLQNQLKK